MHGHPVHTQHVHTQQLDTILRKGRYVNTCIHQLVTVLGNCMSEKLRLKLVLGSGVVLWLGLEIQSGLGLALCLELQLGLDTGLFMIRALALISARLYLKLRVRSELYITHGYI